jgi:hypothetical protein
MVAASALPDDRFERDIAEIVGVPEGLARRRVRQVDLDERPRDAEERIAQGELVWVRPPAFTMAMSKSR